MNCTCLASTSKTLLQLSPRVNYSIRSFSSTNFINSETISTPAVPKSSASGKTPSSLLSSLLLLLIIALTIAIPTSSVPAGTILKGLNFLKTASDPVAKEDSEYPSWLFNLVTPVSKGKGLLLSEDEQLRKEIKGLKKDRGVQIKSKNNLKSR